MATIKEVAERAGVSVATISYVINDGPRPVRPATREKVLKAMAELDYHPDNSARRLARGRTDCLGLAVHGLSDVNYSRYFFLGYIQGVAAAAETRQQNLMLLTGAKDFSSADYYLGIARARVVDGLILLGSGIPDEVMAVLAESGFPTVLLGRREDGVDIPCIHQDQKQGAQLAIRHLRERGHTRIGFLGQWPGFSYGRDRLEAYKETLAETGLPFDPALVSIPDHPRDDPSSEEITRLLEAGATALLTDREIPVFELLKKLGRRVPEEVALMGLEASAPGPFTDPPLSTLQSPKSDLGILAVETLLKVIAGESIERRDITLPMKLVVRASTPVLATR